MKRNNAKRGRKRILTDADFEKIRTGALADLSRTELASVLGISRTALTNYLDTLEAEKKAEVQALRANNSALAKLAIRSLIEQGGIEISQWYLQYKAKLEMERARIALLRAQKKSLELATSPEQTQDALTTSEYWKKVDEYFTNRDNTSPKPTEAGEASEAEAGDNNNGDKD